MASSDGGDGALTRTCSSLELKMDPRMIEMDSHVETAWLGAGVESMARLRFYIAASDYRMLGLYGL